RGTLRRRTRLGSGHPRHARIRPRLRELHRRGRHGPGARLLSARDLPAAGRGQGPVRPGQPVPPQPEHPAVQRVTGGGRGVAPSQLATTRPPGDPAARPTSPTSVSDTGAMSRSWDELVEEAQRDVHRMDAPMGGLYFEKEAADVLAALRLWMGLSSRGDDDWLREHLARDSERLLADARRDLA